MSTADLIIYPRWIIPVEPAGVVHENHALVVEGGRILDILRADLASERYQPNETIKLPQHALIPGLINAHTHAAMTLLRGLADDIPLHPWLHEYVWPAERRWMGAEFVRDGTELAIAEMLRSGTTCFNDMYFSLRSPPKQRAGSVSVHAWE